MVDRTGKAPRSSRLADPVDLLIERNVAWYWSARQRNKRGAYARLAKTIAVANRLGAFVHGPAWTNLRRPSRETMRERINKNENFDAWVAKFGFRRGQASLQGDGAHAGRQARPRPGRHRRDRGRRLVRVA